MLAMLSDPTSATAAPGTPTVTVKTLLKGEIEIPVSAILHCSSPVIGFERLTTWMIYQTQPGWMYWLQSVEDSSVSFCVLDPFAAGIDFDIELGPNDIADLGAKGADDLKVYSTVVLDDDPTQIRTNLRAPILVCARTGKIKQLIIDDPRLPVRFYLRDVKSARNPFVKRS
jgi:flagellar assembly factor FliW